MSTNTKTNNTDEILNETALGGFIAKNKGLSIGLIISIIVAALGYGMYSSSSEKKSYEKSDLISTFKTNFLAHYPGTETKLEGKKDEAKKESKKVDLETLLTKFSELETKLGSFVGMAPLSMELSDRLVSESQNAKALEILERSFSKYASANVNIEYMMSVRLAALYEEAGDFKKSLEYLELARKTKVNVLNSRLRINLARMYFKAGDMEKVNLHLDAVINDEKADKELVPVARALKAKYKK